MYSGDRIAYLPMESFLIISVGDAFIFKKKILLILISDPLVSDRVRDGWECCTITQCVATVYDENYQLLFSSAVTRNALEAMEYVYMSDLRENEKKKYLMKQEKVCQSSWRRIESREGGRKYAMAKSHNDKYGLLCCV